jgi:hypothetical protein
VPNLNPAMITIEQNSTLRISYPGAIHKRMNAMTGKLYDQKISTTPAFLFLVAHSQTNDIMKQQASKE